MMICDPIRWAEEFSLMFLLLLLLEDMGGRGVLNSLTLGVSDMGSLMCGSGNVLDQKVIKKKEGM